MNPYILPLSDPLASLETAGGKGMSLARLASAGLPVPDGFHVTTQAYRQFVSANHLQAAILDALSEVDSAHPAKLETASRKIGRLFADATMPGELAGAIVAAYGALPGLNPPVAVRSSATAEDLPGASFAGQQDTYLNISGADQVLEAVQKCWASLWTARAIDYRARHNIPPESVALAVVVQLLVDAEAAGILFTANPLTGKRDEELINAAWGLGEAVVGGMVTPDSITINKSDGSIASRQIAEKLVMTARTETGTAQQPVPDALKNVAVLSEEQAMALGRYGMQIETLYGAPMDVEWALADGKFAIVQARPITALGETPLEWKPPSPRGIYMRTSVVDLMPDPISPLFATLGIPTLVAQMYPLGAYLTRAKPILPEGYFTTINGYAYMNAKFSPRAWIWIIRMMLSYPRMLRIMTPFWREQALPRYQAAAAQARARDLTSLSAAEIWQAINELMEVAAYYTDTLMFATMGAAAGSEALLTKAYEKLAQRPGDPPATALLMGWDNIPSRAEKSLFDLAGFCREHERLAAYVLETPTEALVEALTSEQSPEGIQPGEWQELRQRFDRHLQDFGFVIFELDFAKPLPCDQPEPMLEVVKMYLRGEGANPYERQKASQERRVRTAQEALGRLKGLRRWAFRKALNWAQSLSEVREDAIAYIGLGYPAMRQMLQALGECLVGAGVLQEAGDIYWLEKSDIEACVAGLDRGAALQSMDAPIKQRKAFWQKAKQTSPPPMLPFRKKYLGFDTTLWLPESDANQAADRLKGVPASPGRATAPACVLRGAEDFEQMRPGHVLVASTTTPAWTPLFAMASAIVTDIGGPLSHGSIVAREYGIPAVMGTGVATRRIHDGQKITVDGGAGTVTITE